MPLVKLHHPDDPGAEIEVEEEQVENYESQGWIAKKSKSNKSE